MSGQKWVGGAWLLPGFGVFRGAAGDNAMHAHCAHQIVIGRHGDVEVGLAQTRVAGRGLAIPSNMAHRLSPAEFLLDYLDPLTVEGRAVFPAESDRESLLSPSLCERLLAASDTAETLRQALRTEFGLPPRMADPRLATVSRVLEASIATSTGIDRAALAATIGLSPTRFSHWFVEQTGLPLRRYRKWLRLVVALNQISQDSNLTQAAHAAGFADSAHLSRTFREMFGMNPLALLQHVALHGAAAIPGRC